MIFVENGAFLSQDGSAVGAFLVFFAHFSRLARRLDGQPASAAFTDHMTDSVVW